MEIIDRKEEEVMGAHADALDWPKIKLNEQALFRLGEALAQMIGFDTRDPKRFFKAESLKKPSAPASCLLPSLACFVESTPHLLLYEAATKLALKVSFRDYTAPMRSKTLATPSGRVLTIGGEKPQSDGGLKYSREIAVFDQRFCMMRVMALLKEPRALHSVVACFDAQGREIVLVLGGKNATGRLASLEKYDVLANTVGLAAPYRVGLAGQSGVPVGAKVYYFGGVVGDAEDLSRSVLIYDLGTDSWASVLPLNPANYVPTLEPLVVSASPSTIYILGGCRRECPSALPSPCTLVQSYNHRQNYLPLEESQLPCCVFGGSGFALSEGVFLGLALTKRDNQSYGPSVPELVKLDLSKGRFSVETLLELV